LALFINKWQRFYLTKIRNKKLLKNINSTCTESENFVLLHISSLHKVITKNFKKVSWERKMEKLAIYVVSWVILDELLNLLPVFKIFINSSSADLFAETKLAEADAQEPRLEELYTGKIVSEIYNDMYKDY
jgi:hypothetical protein